MSQAFLTPYRLFLTPLSPIHLGSGEDYEPTNYVISDGVLYAFDPAQATLNPQQRSELQEAAQSGKIDRIQRYFGKHAQTFAASAYKAVVVSRALEKEYNERIGKVANREAGGKNVYNSLNIERTIDNPLTHQPYIPGSALKGCLRTALLERMVGERAPQPKPTSREASRFESNYLGSFASDGLRLLKTADFMPADDVATQIQYATNHKKKRVVKDGKTVEAKGVTGRRETIQHGQYRAFSATCTIQHLLLAHNPHIKQPRKSLPENRVQPKSLQQLAIDANRYHIDRFDQECSQLDELSLIAPDWLKQTRNLLAQLTPQLQKGSIMLVRLGKHGGAESKTINGLAQIKIMQGEDMEGKAKAPTYEPKTKTVWLAAQSAVETHGLLPFGWALIEIDPPSDNSALQQWCKHNSSHLAAIRSIQAELAERRKQAAAAAAELQAQAQAAEQERIAQAQLEAAEAARRQAELAAMNPAERLVAEWQQQLADFVYDYRNQQAYTGFYQSLLAALNQAAETFSAAEQKNIAEKLSLKNMKKYQSDLFNNRKREDEVKAVLRRLRGE